VFHSGAPYKYERVAIASSLAESLKFTFNLFFQTIKTHTKFVQDVQYAPSGDNFASVGSDAKIFLYDGKTGDTVAEFTDSPHKGSIVSQLCSCNLISCSSSLLRTDRLFVESGQ
jgi:WD40 repeat protein